MKIDICCVGKVKEMINEYTKRLSRYANLSIIEVADEKTPDNASEVVEEGIKKKEGERLFSAIKDNAFVIALAIEGKNLSSTELAEKIGVNEKTVRGWELEKQQPKTEAILK